MDNEPEEDVLRTRGAPNDGVIGTIAPKRAQAYTSADRRLGVGGFKKFAVYAWSFLLRDTRTIACFLIVCLSVCRGHLRTSNVVLHTEILYCVLQFCMRG